VAPGKVFIEVLPSMNFIRGQRKAAARKMKQQQEQVQATDDRCISEGSDSPLLDKTEDTEAESTKAEDTNLAPISDKPTGVEIENTENIEEHDSNIDTISADESNSVNKPTTVDKSASEAPTNEDTREDKSDVDASSDDDTTTTPHSLTDPATPATVAKQSSNVIPAHL
jgi:hypothetical protein